MNMFEVYTLVQVQQEQLRFHLEYRGNQRQLAEAILAQRAEERRFRLMYRVRHWLHRLAPRMARAML